MHIHSESVRFDGGDSAVRLLDGRDGSFVTRRRTITHECATPSEEGNEADGEDQSSHTILSFARRSKTSWLRLVMPLKTI